MKISRKMMWIIMTVCALLLFLLAFLQGVLKLGLNDKFYNDIGSFLLVIAAGVYFYGSAQFRREEKERKAAEEVEKELEVAEEAEKEQKATQEVVTLVDESVPEKQDEE